MILSIGGVAIGGDTPCRTVAEISCNHNGKIENALRLISAAKDAGADLVKFQCYTPDELVALRGDGPAPAQWGEQGWTMRALYEKAQTPHEWFPAIAEYCRDIEIPWFSSVFGADSLKLLESLDCPAYKLAALDRNQKAFVRQVRATKKPTIRSVRVEKYGQPDVRRYARRDALLLCPEGYPQDGFPGLSYGAFNDPDEGMYRSDFDGFSYHGTDPLPCVVAATLGAKIIEAHLHLAEEPSELEANVSLDQHQWRRMVDDIRRVEALLA